MLYLDLQFSSVYIYSAALLEDCNLQLLNSTCSNRMCLYLQGRRISDDGDVNVAEVCHTVGGISDINNEDDDEEDKVSPRSAQGIFTPTVRKSSRIIKSKIVNLMLKEI